MENFKILDVFSGAGGLSYGMEMIDGFDTVLATDFNEQALDTFKYNHPNSEIIIGDITDKEIKKLIVDTAKKLGVNMIVGGPPCQGFSNKGKKLGLKDERNFLFLEYIELVKRISPDIFVIENVKTMITSADGYFINEIVDNFKDMGYQVSYSVLNSYDFGVPQKRERAIIIGSKDSKFDFSDLFLEDYPKTTVRDAIGDLSFVNSGEGEYKIEYNTSTESDYQDLMRKDSDYLYNHIATNHSKLALKKLKLIPPECGKEYLPKELLGNQKFRTTWGRLQWDIPSPTIDTRFDTPSNGTNSHPFLHRSITPREAARIQSFPDRFIFNGNKTEICKQIGNAVPPLLSKAIAKSIKRQFSYFDISIKKDNYELYNGNSNYIINFFKKNNLLVDHIITDPPYSISQKNNFNTMNSANRQGVDFGIWDDNFNYTSWINEYSKLINKNGSFIIFCSYLYISYIIDELTDSGFVVKDLIEWKKTNPMPRNINRRYVQDTEFAIWAVKKNSKWVFNKPDDVPYLRSTFTTSTVSGKERTKHPTQKSLKLMEHLIQIHTNENDVVLDPFMGSGTTGVACINNNRKFIGVEISPVFFDICLDRMENGK